MTDRVQVIKDLHADLGRYAEDFAQLVSDANESHALTFSELSALRVVHKGLTDAVSVFSVPSESPFERHQLPHHQS